MLQCKEQWFPRKKVIYEKGKKARMSSFCPLFVLAVEIMACKIRQNNNIKGYRLKGIPREIKISQYVDDLTFCTRDNESMPHVIETIEEFGKIARPRLNLNKTEGIWLAPLKD